MAFPKRYQDAPPEAPPSRAKVVAPPPKSGAKQAAKPAARPAPKAGGHGADAPEPRPTARRGSDDLLIVLLITAAFLGSYSYALSVSGSRSAAGNGSAIASASPVAQGSLDPNAKVENGVQTVYIDAASGFNPQTVFAKPDIPLKIKFGPGQGCYSAVQFPQFNIYKDLTQGGAEIDLGKLKPGQYQFACGMNMAYGLVVVR